MRPRRLLIPLGTAALVGVPGVALAAWTATGSGAAAAKAAAVTAPTSVTVPATSTGTVAVSWSGATGPAGSTPKYLVERVAGGSATAVCGSTFSAPISGSSCNDSSVPTGTYTYRVTTRLGDLWQAASNPSSSVVVTVPVALSVSTPDLVSASDSGTSDTDNLTNVTTPTFTGTATAGSTVTLYDGSTPVGTAVATAGSWSITSSALTGGAGTAHTLTASATLAGSTVSSSGSLVVTVDTSAPTPGAIAVANNNTNSNGKTLSGTASTSTSHPGTLTTVTISVSGTGCTVSPSTAAVGATGAWSGPAVSLNNNTTCQATASLADTAGNVGTTTVTVTRS